MAHPHITAARRPLLVAGLAAGTIALSWPAAQALPGTDVQVTDAAEALCSATQGEVLTEAVALPADCTALQEALPADAEVPAADPLASMLAPLQDALDEVTAEVPAPAVTPAVPDSPSAPSVSEPPATTPGNAAPAPSAPAAPGPVAADPVDDAKEVSAAGKTPTEVVEPSGPAHDGRVEESPLVPATTLGPNIQGLRSESALTLQPYQPPVVSVPFTFDAPQIAGTSSTPAASSVPTIAAPVVQLAGDALLATTTGVGAWVTATGLGILVGGAYALQRRRQTVTLESLGS